MTQIMCPFITSISMNLDYLVPSNYFLAHFLFLQRDAGRPPVPRQKSEEKIEEQPLLSNHPYVDRVILIQALPDKYIYFLLFTILHASEGISQ